MGHMKQVAEQTSQEQPKPFALALREQMEGKQPEIAAMLGATKMDPERFVRVALLAATKNPGLRECSVQSVFLAVMESARLGLQPDNKEAAIVKFGEHAELLPMVGGIIRLMLRSPGLLKVEARVVRDGDEFDYRYGLDPQLVHKPVGGSDREITHAYAVMWRQGAGTTFEVVTREEIEQVRSASRAPNSPAWKQWGGEMARKVALKRLAKYADLSPEATRAIELDHFVAGAEPWAGEWVDESAEEYRNRATKARTEDRMADLRARLTGDELQDHPSLEQEVAQVPPAEAEGSPETDQASPAAEGTEEPAKPPDQITATDFWKWVNAKGLEKVADAIHINASDSKETRKLMGKWVETEMRGIWGDALMHLQALEKEGKIA